MGATANHTRSKSCVMAMYPGNRHIDKTRTIFLLTPSYENMTSLGVIMHTRAHNELLVKVHEDFLYEKGHIR